MQIRRLRIDLNRLRANTVILPSGRPASRQEVLDDLDARGFEYEGDGWWSGDPAMLNRDEVLEVEKEPGEREKDGTEA